MRTNVPHIFASGDIVGQSMLAHKMPLAWLRMWRKVGSGLELPHASVAMQDLTPTPFGVVLSSAAIEIEMLLK